MKKSEQMKNMGIGVFVVISLAIATWLLLFLSPESGDAAKSLTIQFTDIDKVTLGTRVTYGGKPVGEVESIRLIPDARQQAVGRERDVYVYELTVSLDSSITVYNTDKITVRTSGLLGEKNIAIMPQIPKPGVESYVITNEIMRASGGGSMEEALMELEGLADKASAALDDIIDLIDANNKDINLAIKSVHQSLTGVSVFMERLNELDVAGTVSRASEDFGRVMEQVSAQMEIVEQRDLMNTISDIAGHVNSITAAVDQPEELANIIVNVQKLSDSLEKLQTKVSGSWEKVDATLDNFVTAGENTVQITEDLKASGTRIKELVDSVGEGNGSIGKFLHSDDFYLRLVSVMNKLETVMNDVNHYGILFHLDKGWQRQRVRRMNLLQELCTAEQFRDYFEEEVDQISTSLSRVSMLMRRAEYCQDSAQPLLDDREFAEVFSELLRQVEGLEGTLKLYNSSLLDKDPCAGS